MCEDISDHFPTYLDIDLNTNFSTDDIKTNDEKRKYNKQNYTLFENVLKETNWNHLLTRSADASDPNVLYAAFSNTFKDLFDHALPLETGIKIKLNKKI